MLVSTVGIVGIPLVRLRAERRSVAGMVTPDRLQCCFLAEWYRPAVVNRDIDEVAATLGDAVARMHVQGHRIRLVAAVAASTDQVLYGVFAADSVATVAHACSGAGWPADRITGGIQVRIRH
jgi:hypothetical protein